MPFQNIILKGNPDKTESLLIILKHNINPSPLFLDNHQLKMVDSHKHLGITFNSTLSWNDHVDNIASKANRKIFVMAKLKILLDRKTLLTMYTSFIRPSLEYGSIIWQSCTQGESDKLESIQTRAGKIITGGISRTKTALLYNELNIEPLETRRNRQLLLFFYKLMHNNLPQYLHELRPPENINRHNRNLRNRNALDLPKFRLKKYENSLALKATSLWNLLPIGTKELPNFKSFKAALEKKYLYQMICSTWVKGKLT